MPKAKKMTQQVVEVAPPDTTPPAVPLEPPVARTTGRRKKKSGDKLYFNADTQKAIVAYQQVTNNKDRTKLYVQEILPAFEKLVENLINIHKFTS